jgi:MFS family permease
VALRYIAGGLGVSEDEASWVVTTYLVANAVSLTISAFLAKLLGRKAFFLICLALFTAASVLCGIAWTLPLLLLFRIMQGLGGGGMVPVASSILVDTFPPEKRGETINTMTLGGLALAVGILVDDSTVTTENTYRLLDEEKMPLPRATLHGAAEIAMPTLVSTLAISCVFTSVVFLEGPAKYLFTPLGLAVVFAMLASYGLSRTLTPITIGQILKGYHDGGSAPSPYPSAARGGGKRGGFFSRLHASFERSFERMREGYVRLLTMLLTRPAIVPIVAAFVLALGAVMFRFCRPRFLSRDRRWHDPAPCPRAARRPHRDDRADFPEGRGQDPRDHSEERPRSDRRQSRAAGGLL